MPAKTAQLRAAAATDFNWPEQKMTGAARIFGTIALLSALAWPASAAELVLFETSDCVWCEAWDEEIGGIYPKTVESEIAPLRRVDIHEARPADLTHIRGIVYTPTFVLLDNGREAGRIVGYGGEEIFWGLLGIELKKLDRDTKATLRIPPAGAAAANQQE